MTTTHAAVTDEPGAPPAIVEVDLVAPGPTHVVVDVAAAGICHTDLVHTAGEGGSAFPMVAGHEVAGVVRGVGTAVGRFRAGDRVVLSNIRHCGFCPACTAGRPMSCPDRPDPAPAFSRGGEAVHPLFGLGGFATTTVVDQSQCIHVPDDVPLEVAAVSGCGTVTGWGIVTNITRVRPGESVAVVGCGPVGLNVVMAARAVGAGAILAVDPVAARREAARELGASVAVAPEAARDVRDGWDHVVEVAGNADALELSLQLSRAGGAVTIAGVHPQDATLTLGLFAHALSRRTLHTCIMGEMRNAADLDRIFTLFRASVLPLDRLVTDRVPLDEVAEGMDRAARGEGLRTVVVPRST